MAAKGRRARGGSGTFVPEGGASPRGPGAFREWPAVLVLAAVAVSLVIGTLFGFRAAAVMLGCCCVLAAALRLVLAEAGILAVRSRVTDVAVLLVLGGVVVLLGLSVPPAVVDLPLMPRRSG